MLPYTDEQYIITSQRLKELRLEKKLSHQRLQQELNKKYGTEDDKDIISINTLKQYEVIDKNNDKFEKVGGMAIKTLYMFADFYNVSTDYLLGLSNIKTSNVTIKGICDYTGLSEKSIDFLHNITDQKNGVVVDEQHLLNIEDIKDRTPDMIEAQKDIWNIQKQLQKEFTLEEWLQMHYDRLKDENEFELISSKFSAEMVINALNVVLEKNNSVDFFKQLAIYLFSDFSYHRDLIAVGVDKANNMKNIELSVNTKIMSEVCIIEIERIIREWQNKEKRLKIVDWETMDIKQEFDEGVNNGNCNKT